MQFLARVQRHSLFLRDGYGMEIVSEYASVFVVAKSPRPSHFAPTSGWQTCTGKTGRTTLKVAP
jgi:hypothetical protein